MKGVSFVPLNMERKWALHLVIASLICIFLIATSFNLGIFSSLPTINSLFLYRASTKRADPAFFEQGLSRPLGPPAEPPLPRFAYLISGSKGDLEKLWRTLQSLYHPLNQYVVHLDLESSLKERLELASRVEREPIFSKLGNVYMITKANMVTYRGPTMVSNTLHACAILLKRSQEWDWFINLSASDYPLVTQDDLIYTFSKLNRSLNFIEHTSNLGWKEGQRAMPLLIDPGLYSTTKSDIFFVEPKRSLPTAFKLFTGSAWMVLSRAFVEYMIWGWDNLPRTMLMYYTNFVSSPEGYFHTVICNTPEFNETAVNHDMHYISWDTPPQQHPHTLSLNDTEQMITSNAAFARKFHQDDPVLDKIDRELLSRRNGSFTLGGWCTGKPRCTKVGNARKMRPGPGSERLSRLISWTVFSDEFKGNQCK
ncbi:hypothetical protein Droror1_Dr00020239 [Drosera rotundifolia]